VQKRVPGIEGSTVVRWWTRPDSFAPDGKPIIGAVEEFGGLYLNTAAAGKGHKVAPAAGLALSELVADGRSSTVDLEPFRLGRFKSPLKPWSDSEYGKRVIG
jgi:glycine/D-amino acid oxidase-like deaminating enzyme